MKYAFMSFSTPEHTLDQMIEMAERYGYDGIEPRVMPDHAHGISPSLSDAQRAEVRQKFERSNVDLCCIAVSCKYADPATVDQNVSETLASIDLAADLGCSRLRVFGGRYPEDQSRANALRCAVDGLKAVADQAAKRGVTLCLETHDAWCDSKDVVALMEAVEHSHVMVNWDIMHPVKHGGRTMDEAHHMLKPWIRHMHVHDGRIGEKGILPIGTGDIDHRRAIELVLNDGYEGYISGEWPNFDPPEAHLPRELATLKQYERECNDSM